MQGWNTEAELADEAEAPGDAVEAAAEDADDADAAVDANDADALVESRAAERSADASESGSTAESGAAAGDDAAAGRTAANMAAMEGVAALPAGTACLVLARWLVFAEPWRESAEPIDDPLALVAALALLLLAALLSADNTEGWDARAGGGDDSGATAALGAAAEGGPNGSSSSSSSELALDRCVCALLVRLSNFRLSVAEMGAGAEVLLPPADTRLTNMFVESCGRGGGAVSDRGSETRAERIGGDWSETERQMRCSR